MMLPSNSIGYKKDMNESRLAARTFADSGRLGVNGLRLPACLRRSRIDLVGGKHAGSGVRRFDQLHVQLIN